MGRIPIFSNKQNYFTYLFFIYLKKICSVISSQIEETISDLQLTLVDKMT